MRRLNSIARAILSLFIEDGSFAIAIAAWVVVCVVMLPRLAAGARWAGSAFFVGLALVLIESVLRFARRRTK